MERIATQQPEYVDIVLGYHHIVLFSLLFGALVFGTGYFVGYHFAVEERAPRNVVSTPTPSAAKQAVATSPGAAVTVPALITEPGSSAGQDVVKDMERFSGVESEHSALPAQSGSEPAATRGESATAAAAAASEPAAAKATESAPIPAVKVTEPAKSAVAKPTQLAQPAAPQGTETTKPAAKKAAEQAKPRAQARPVAPPKGHTPAREPQQAAKLNGASAAGSPRDSIYLQVSSFGTQQDAQKLIDDLTGEGYRALLDSAVVSGKHTVLVGPFSDFKAAVGQATQLKQTNHEAFPIRR